MYAIVRTGNKQYRVEANAVIDVEKLSVNEGDSLTLEDVLLVVPDSGSPSIGQPVVNGAKVVATCISQYRGPKIHIWKYKPKQRYRLRKGHRQSYTRLKIESITVG